MRSRLEADSDVNRSHLERTAVAWLIVWDVASFVSIFVTLLLGGGELQVLEVLGVLDIALFVVRVLEVLIAGGSDIPMKRKRRSSTREEAAWAWGTTAASLVVAILTGRTTANNGLAALGAGISTVVLLATLRAAVKRARQVP